jgi:hypothetical protein
MQKGFYLYVLKNRGINRYVLGFKVFKLQVALAILRFPKKDVGLLNLLLLF